MAHSKRSRKTLPTVLSLQLVHFGHRSPSGNVRHHELAQWTGDDHHWPAILGPGEPQMAHQTDEYCVEERVRTATRAFVEIMQDWCCR